MCTPLLRMGDKSETFLIPDKTFVDIFIGFLQEIVLCKCLNRFYQSNRGHLGIRKFRVPNLLRRVVVRYPHHTSLQTSQDFSRFGKESKME